MLNFVDKKVNIQEIEVSIVSEKTVQEELAEDLVSIIHSFSGNLYGMRRKAFKQIENDIAELGAKVTDGNDERGSLYK